MVEKDDREIGIDIVQKTKNFTLTEFIQFSDLLEGLNFTRELRLSIIPSFPELPVTKEKEFNEMGKTIFGWYIKYIINGFRHEKDKFNVLYYNNIGLGLNYDSTLEYYKQVSKNFYGLMNMDTDLSIHLDKSTLEYYKHVSNNFYGLMNIDPELSIRWEIERWTNFI